MEKTIHVIEDDEGIRELVAFLLNERGYKVITFGSVTSFKRRVVDRPLPALVIIDIMLPDGNGLDVCQAWKTNPLTQGIPVLLMSAYEDFKSNEKTCYADGFIGKPFDIKAFLNEVERCL